MSYIVEVEVEKCGAYADIEIREMLSRVGLKVLSSRKSQRLEKYKVSNRLQNLTLEDCFKRASDLFSYGSYSGRLIDNKDLKRIVLMADYIKTLESKINDLQ